MGIIPPNLCMVYFPEMNQTVNQHSNVLVRITYVCVSSPSTGNCIKLLDKKLSNTLRNYGLQRNRIERYSFTVNMLNI